MQQGHVPVLQATILPIFPCASLQQRSVPWSLLCQVQHAMLRQIQSQPPV